MLWTLSDFYSPIMQAHKVMCKLFTAQPRSASSARLLGVQRQEVRAALYVYSPLFVPAAFILC